MSSYVNDLSFVLYIFDKKKETRKKVEKYWWKYSYHDVQEETNKQTNKHTCVLEKHKAAKEKVYKKGQERKQNTPTQSKKNKRKRIGKIGCTFLWKEKKKQTNRSRMQKKAKQTIGLEIFPLSTVITTNIKQKQLNWSRSRQCVLEDWFPPI